MCGVAGSSPNLKQQSNEKVKMMIDSGSFGTACCVDFSKDYATDDSERAELWDVQDQKVEAQGKQNVDVMVHGQTGSHPSQHQRKRCSTGQTAEGRI